MRITKRARKLVLVAVGITVLGSVVIWIGLFNGVIPRSLDLVREGDRLKRLEITCWDERDSRISSTITVSDRDKLDMLELWLASREDGWLAPKPDEAGASSMWRKSSEGVFVWESEREMGFFTAFRWLSLEGYGRRMGESDYDFLRSYCGEL